jgi:cytochrome c-type biogenesis protein CcmF
MNQIGYTGLLLALVLSAFAMVAPVLGVRLGRHDLIKAGERGAYALAGVVVLSSASLLWALMSRDFTNLYVWEYTSRELSWFYTISAFWAGNQGSMLLWLLILSVFLAIVVYQNRQKNRELLPYVIAILSAIAFFFSLLLTVVSGDNPFLTQAAGAANGQGLNPMLENPGMVIHPVTLYLGYVGFSIPFAFAMGALITKRLGDQWIRSTRRWTLLAWVFLTMGNIVGAWWAYVTLGWGGFWAWDPVENASLLPWLTGTAFLHSVMIQEKKDMLKVWNIVLITVTFTLTIFGTFLTRSGIISSVHSFGQSSLGYWFVGFMALTLIFSLNLLFSRLDLLKSRNELDSFVSRESSFLLNNLILLAMAFTVLWGVLWPIISEAVTGNKATVGPPFFNQVMTPFGLLLLFITGVCPLIAWRKASLANLRKNFVIPGSAALIVLVLLLVFGVRHVYALISYTICSFVLAVVVMEFVRGTWVRHQMTGENVVRAFFSLIWHNKRRYGGYTVHIGVVLLLIGVTSFYAFKESGQKTLKKGDTMTVGEYTLTYDSFTSYSTNEKQVGELIMTVKQNGQPLGVVKPTREYYVLKEQPWTRIDRITSLKRDVYVSLLDYQDNGGEVLAKVDINPGVSWLWIGGFVMLLGGIIAIWPDKREQRRLAARYERQARLHEV